MTSPFDRMIMASVKCTICGAGYGKCDCWKKCPRCGWSFQKGKKCRSPQCGGDGNLDVVAEK
jgi:hypothetical protein